MAKYSLVRDGVVENVIIIEDPAAYPAPEGFELIEWTDETGGCGPGWGWDGTVFTPPPEENDPSNSTG